MPASSEGDTPRKKTLGKALHKQWIATATGRALHDAHVSREKKRAVPALDRKGGKRWRVGGNK
jgi:hypothetical protein